MKLGSQKPETLQILGCVTRDRTQKVVDLSGGYHIYITRGLVVVSTKPKARLLAGDLRTAQFCFLIEHGNFMVACLSQWCNV